MPVELVVERNTLNMSFCSSMGATRYPLIRRVSSFVSTPGLFFASGEYEFFVTPKYIFAVHERTKLFVFKYTAYWSDKNSICWRDNELFGCFRDGQPVIYIKDFNFGCLGSFLIAPTNGTRFNMHQFATDFPVLGYVFYYLDYFKDELETPLYYKNYFKGRKNWYFFRKRGFNHKFYVFEGYPILDNEVLIEHRVWKQLPESLLSRLPSKKLVEEEISQRVLAPPDFEIVRKFTYRCESQ